MQIIDQELSEGSRGFKLIYPGPSTFISQIRELEKKRISATTKQQAKSNQDLTIEINKIKQQLPKNMQSF